MRILHILDHSVPLHSGYTFRTLAILREQRALGWETHHLTGPKQGARLTEEDAEGLHFHRTPATNGMLSRLPIAAHWQVVRALAKRLEPLAIKLKPDVLHAHSPALNGLAALRVGSKLGLPVVYEVRAFWEDAAVDHGTSSEGGPRYRLTRALETHVLRRADHVTTICEGLRRDIVARGIPADKVTVIPNAVNPEAFPFDAPSDTALATELGLTGKTVLGFVGSFYRYEGLDLLLDAMSLVARERRDICLLLVGGGPQEEALRTQANALQLQDHVHFTGRIPHDQIGRYYSVIDWMVYPRRSKRLTELVTPLKPLEAMALGKPVLASNVGGHRELIVDGENGILFPADSPERLASKVLEFVTRKDSKAILGHNGRRFIEHQRTWAASVAYYANVYFSMTQGNQSGNGRERLKSTTSENDSESA
ncbi:MAG TPA: TIGR04063 family PEP-CTERM/XrtA system glycosyltransferase [Gammaproteobacteria bacterium]|nr:TIGR04063 family PEP-CTERM/XrtA system glycosyltransferase [Gammaproteobacteria bacterium]